MKRIILQTLTLLLCLSPLVNGADSILESARNIPVAYDVDVVVVGGTSSGVAAAVEAAQNGAKVFLAAPRPYLGEDLCATYRLWLEHGEEPSTALAKTLFAQPEIMPLIGKKIPITYEANKPSAAIHRDTKTPSILTDGTWSNASSQSVQYNGHVTLIADLSEKQLIETTHVMAYQRNGEFAVERVIVSIGNDKNSWKQVAVIQNKKLGQITSEQSSLNLFAPIKQSARYVKFDVRQAEEAERILLGEILVVSETPSPVEKKRLPPTPMQVKRTLDRALLDAGVQFLYSCIATDVLTDREGKNAGIVMVNRSGRQAVKAKVIIDAMPRADIARIAGAKFEPYPAGPQTFKRIVIGGEIRSGDRLHSRKMPSPVRTEQGNYQGIQPGVFDAIEYTLTIPMQDGSFASFAKADQQARDWTWQPGQVDSSEVLFQVPPDPMKGKKSLSGAWPGAEKTDLAAFQPKGFDRLYVLGGCADISRQAAEKLMSPLTLLDMGTRIGRAAAEEAKRIPSLRGVRLAKTKTTGTDRGEVRELLVGVRPIEEDLPTIPSEDRAIPILGEYDVVVIGGGTGGAPAGIGAARQGAKTLVIEYLHGLGGVGTLGLIGRYYFGYREGFTAEVDRGISTMRDDLQRRPGGWNVENKMQWYRSELRKAGADIWFGSLGCGSLVVDGCVKGVVVATPAGRGIVLCKTAIDSTGSADIAISAGAAYKFTGSEDAALQGTGLPPRQPGANYTNTDYTFSDESDLVDVWRTMILAKEKFKDAYDMGQIIDTRERRRIVGDYTISPLDIMNRRTFPDTVNLARSNFDTHGFTTHDIFMLKPPDKKEVIANTPYRALLPKGLDGIIVTGLGISAHRDAMPILRMQACIQNQGYSMGVAASMAATTGKGTRGIDIKALQKHLIEKDSLPKRVLTDQDSFPLSQDTVAEAVRNAANNYGGVGIVLAQPRDSVPLLRMAYEVADEAELKAYLENPPIDQIDTPPNLDVEKLIYAHILGMMGDNSGVETLLSAVEAQEWDQGWKFTGMGQFGGSLSPYDCQIIALARTEDKRALKPILEKLERLDASSEFSHHRAIALSLETLGDPAAAKPLADHLSKPKMSGHAMTDIHKARRTPPTTATDTGVRDRTLRELILARALYRCGDYQEMGEKILKQYERDLRGHYARHAHAILQEKQ